MKRLAHLSCWWIIWGLHKRKPWDVSCGTLERGSSLQVHLFSVGHAAKPGTHGQMCSLSQPLLDCKDSRRTQLILPTMSPGPPVYSLDFQAARLPAGLQFSPGKETGRLRLGGGIPIAKGPWSDLSWFSLPTLPHPHGLPWWPRR